MGIMSHVKAKARLSIKRIVLPEGDEPRTVQAAAQIRDEQLATPILLGNPQRIQEVAASTGANIAGIEIIDPLDSPKAASYAQLLYELRLECLPTKRD